MILQTMVFKGVIKLTLVLAFLSKFRILCNKKMRVTLDLKHELELIIYWNKTSEQKGQE
jgi:hypothetical protein